MRRWRSYGSLLLEDRVSISQCVQIYLPLVKASTKLSSQYWLMNSCYLQNDSRALPLLTDRICFATKSHLPISTSPCTQQSLCEHKTSQSFATTLRCHQTLLRLGSPSSKHTFDGCFQARTAQYQNSTLASSTLHPRLPRPVNLIKACSFAVAFVHANSARNVLHQQVCNHELYGTTSIECFWNIVLGLH